MDAGVPLATIQRWLGHHNISQTSVCLGASLGGDGDDMARFEQRLGRLAVVTNRDLSDVPNGSDPTRSDSEAPKIPEKNPIGPNPSGVVH